MARLAIDKNATFDFSQEYWHHHISDIADRISKKLNGVKMKIGSTFAIKSKDKSILITHPFWSPELTNSYLAQVDSNTEPMDVHAVVRRSNF